jgi:hypothetical protein
MEQSDDWVQVRNCNWLHQAQFLKSVLESEGIDVQLPDEHVLGVQPFYGAAIGGVRVMVRPADLQRATELLDSVADADPPGASDEDE